MDGVSVYRVGEIQPRDCACPEGGVNAEPADDNGIAGYCCHSACRCNVMSAIDDKYTELGGTTSFLGHPEHEERACPDSVGRYRQFKHGSIHWHPDTGAHETHGTI